MAFEAGDKDNDQAKVADKGRHCFSFKEKKRVPRSPELVDELQQASSSNWVADAGRNPQHGTRGLGKKL